MKIIKLIKNAQGETSSVVSNSAYLHNESSEIVRTRKILELLLKSVEKNEVLNERLQRAVCDLGMFSFKYFENTDLEEALNNVSSFFYDKYSAIERLNPLGHEFGEGDPI